MDRVLSRVCLPTSPVGRVRLLFLGLAVVSAGATVAALLSADEPLAIRLGAALLGLGLVAHWVAGYRRREFPVAAEPIEAAILFVLLRVTPGDPFLPLFGLVFRGLYGNQILAAVRYCLWVAALLGAHAPRGSADLEADLARALGLALAPLLMQALRGALQSSEASERRLRSLVQNSTDVMTVVGDDMLVRWQAESIRRVLGHDPAGLLNTPFLDLIHRHDRPQFERYFAEAREQPDRAESLAVRVFDGDGGYRPSTWSLRIACTTTASRASC